MYEAFTFQREQKTTELSSKYQAFTSQKMEKPLFKYEAFVKKMTKRKRAKLSFKYEALVSQEMAKP
jgi:hypothetical protein